MVEPLIAFDAEGTLSYDAATDLLSVDTFPVTMISEFGVGPFALEPPALLQIRAYIDDSGTVVGGVPGDDLVVAGSIVIDTDGDGEPEHYEGVLLTGEIVDFGFQDGGGPFFDFLFRATGGELGHLFDPDPVLPTIGVELTDESNSFPGTFTASFAGGAKGFLGKLPEPPGPEPPPPCTRTIGYWKTHPEAWPVEEVTLGAVTYEKIEAIDEILRRPPRGDATRILARQLIAAKLNVASGADSTGIAETIAAADAWLVAHPVDSDPDGSDRQDGIDLAETLDAFNNG